MHLSRKQQIIAAIFTAIIVFVVTVILAGRANASTLGPTWEHRPHHWPYIIVEKHAHHFPVITATKHWGKPLHNGRCVGHPNLPCVRVYSGNFGDDGVASVMVYSTRSSMNYFAEVQIYMNSYYGNRRNFDYRLQAVEHELGHAMGLDHDRSGGVMQAGCDGKHTHITAYERRELRHLYGV